MFKHLNHIIINTLCRHKAEPVFFVNYNIIDIDTLDQSLLLANLHSVTNCKWLECEDVKAFVEIAEQIPEWERFGSDAT